MKVIDNDKIDEIYRSMLQTVFQEYCDLCIAYVEESRVQRLQEMGRTKAHTQKKRAKNGLFKLPKAKRVSFLNGCYDELGVQLLRQLRREVVDADFEKSTKFLTEIISEEKKNMVSWLKDVNKDSTDMTE